VGSSEYDRDYINLFARIVWTPSRNKLRRRMSKSKTPEPLYRQFTPEEDRGKTFVSKYYRVNQNMDGLGVSLHPYLVECNIRIDFGLDGGIYKVEWSNKVLNERKKNG